ncbi:unnamed protein product [Rhizoctonia solani]|uniref:Uncharacterized protein n=1 Tax=Rhizoctonia solani TaxID=456999 RepID=A0A8H3HXQ6_9AGAM|nr:unnamed protein product [Rhizoctonia solani]CAE7129823.1 unnamed protein product [Rhizoctonia solani]
MNVRTQDFEAADAFDAYDADYHWGGVSIYPEGPIPTEIEYPGLPAGMTLPPGVPLDLDLFVTPAPPHLAHIPLVCPGAPRPDKKPVKRTPLKRKAGVLAPIETVIPPKRRTGIYGPSRRVPFSRPTYVYAYPCDGERWAHQPEHLRPVEMNSRVQTHCLVVPEEEYEYQTEPVDLVLRVEVPAEDIRVSSASYPSNVDKALQNFRVQYRKSI